MKKIMRKNGIFEFLNEFLNEFKDKKKDYYIVCLDIISFRTINEIYGFEQGDVILKELINHIHNLDSSMIIKSFIYEKDSINLIIDSTQEKEIKEIIREIVSSTFSYDINFRCAYSRILNSNEAIKFIENINKIIRKTKYIIVDDSR